METHWQQKEQTPTKARITKIRNYRKQRIQYSTTSPIRLGGGSPYNKKGKNPTAITCSTVLRAGATTAAELEKLLDTCTDTQFAGVIHDLPENWQTHNLKGN